VRTRRPAQIPELSILDPPPSAPEPLPDVAGAAVRRQDEVEVRVASASNVRERLRSEATEGIEAIEAARGFMVGWNLSRPVRQSR
jgi:hypothetical protein